MSSGRYLIPAGITTYEQEIKRSKFLTRIIPINNPEQAKAWIHSIREEFPDARHVCWAYISGSPDSHLKSMSDDGEPSGTAGKPMLNVLEHSGVGDIAAAVVRYFGGIKLGTGGLVRAYSSSVSEAMQKVELINKIPMAELSLEFCYADETQVRHFLITEEGEVGDVNYTDSVEMRCRLPADHVNSLKAKLPISVVVREK